MNKKWIEHSHNDGVYFREELLDNKYNVELKEVGYLDTIGLFETSWMIYDFDVHDRAKDKYGYPR